jgi:hypothetical protein
LCAILQRHDFKFEAVFFGEVTLADHQHEAGIALGLDDAVLPRLEIGRLGSVKAGQQPKGRYGGTGSVFAVHVSLPARRPGR